MRELVEPEVPQEPPDARYPLVVPRDRLPQPPLLGPFDHRPELEDAEGFSVLTEPLLAEEDRPLRVELDGGGGENTRLANVWPTAQQGN